VAKSFWRMVMVFGLTRRVLMGVVLCSAMFCVSGCSKGPSGVYADDSGSYTVDF
jgi:hypothetical protein